MKKIFQFLVTLSVVILFCVGCKREGCTDPTAANYNSKATKNDGSCKYVCNAINSTASGSCGSGYVVVSGGYCCPTSKPYTCASAPSCYATCEDAQAAGCTAVEEGIYQTSGGGGGSGYVCYGGSCSYVSSGASYTSLSSCQSNCSSGGSAGYKCSGGTCSYVSSGASYTSLTSCQNNCGSSAGYVCSGGSCSYVSSGASYTSLSSCQSNCSSSAGYVCSGGSCSYVSSGASYTSLSSCQSNCGGGSTGQLLIWNSNSSAGTISVYVNGSYVGSISSYYSSTPSCGASGGITITRSPGSYSVSGTNTNGDTYSPVSINIVSGGCSKMQLY